MKVTIIVAQNTGIKGAGSIDTFLFLGIAQLGAVLEKYGHNITVIDLRLKRNHGLDINRRIKELAPDLIILTSFFSSILKLKTMGREIKRMSKAPVAIGGIYPSIPPIKSFDYHLAMELFGKDKFWDYMIIGEGEYVYPKLLGALASKNEPAQISGLVYRKKSNPSKLIYTGGAPIIEDLGGLPFNAFHLFDIKDYLPLPKHFKKTPILPLTTSRDCAWGRCEFCFQARIKGFYRRQSPSRAVSEIKHLVKKYSIKDIRFWDDDFVHSHAWVSEFCKLLKNERLDVIWNCHTRVNMVTESLLKQMADAGCWQILYGVESGSQETLNDIKKGTLLKQAKNAILLTKKCRIEARASFILGLPGEGPEGSDETIRFAETLDADLTQFCLFTPYPGTVTYSKLKRSGRLSKDYSLYDENHAVYIPARYSSLEEVQKKFRHAYRMFYLNPVFLLKCISKIRSMDDVWRYYSGMKVALGLGLR